MKLSEIDVKKIDNELIKKLFFNVKKEEYNHADYLIIYGCHLKPLLDERLKHALDIINKCDVKKIVLTGGVGVHGDFNESEYMYNYLIENGIDKDSILIENKSTTTEENNINILNMLNMNGITEKTNVVLVTQELHMIRLMIHWKKILNNPNIIFYYDYMYESIISYDNVIKNEEFLKIVYGQVQKIVEYVNNGTYVDMEIE